MKTISMAIKISSAVLLHESGKAVIVHNGKAYLEDEDGK